MGFENMFVILSVETFLAVFLLYNYYSVRTMQDGNIYEQWQNRGKQTLRTTQNSFFANIFKKHKPETDQNVHELDDVFTEFIQEMRLYFHIATIFMVYLLLKMCTRALNREKIANSHVLPPGKFDGNQNAYDWLENFELYLDEDNIIIHSERCAALLSRLDGKIKQMLVNYDKKVKTNYKTLKQAFLKIYGLKKKTPHEYQADFLMTNQNEMNLYYFHAELCRLAKKAFPDLSESQRSKQVHDRFINGIESDMLRSSILASYKENGIFSSIYGGKSLLDRAVELEEIYDRKQVEINFVHGNPANTQCYNCLEMGHYKSECKNPKANKFNQTNRSQHQTQQPQQQQQNQTQRPQQQQQPQQQQPQQTQQRQHQKANQATINHFNCNRIEYTSSITGHCALDGKQTKFLMDTGANKTVIDVRLLNSDQRDEIIPSEFRVILADGSRVPVLGLRRSKVRLGKHTVELDVLVTEKLHEGCLLGIDFLQKCPSTCDLIQQLKFVAKDNECQEYEIQTCLMPLIDINNNSEQ